MNAAKAAAPAPLVHDRIRIDGRVDSPTAEMLPRASPAPTCPAHSTERTMDRPKPRGDVAPGILGALSALGRRWPEFPSLGPDHTHTRRRTSARHNSPIVHSLPSSIISAKALLVIAEGVVGAALLIVR